MKKIFLTLLLTISLAHPSWAAPVYTFPIAGCKTTYGKYHHDYPASDIKAKFGCAFVAPINGVVEDVSTKDRWSGKTNLGIDRGGLYVSVIGEDGVRYYGSHLRSVVTSIQSGTSVKAGQILGRIGATGSARGTKPHLHFGISWPTPTETQPNIWWVRRGIVSPWKYLNNWKIGKDSSPAKAVSAALLKNGEIPPPPKK